MKYIVVMPARGCAQPKKGGLVKKGQNRSKKVRRHLWNSPMARSSLLYFYFMKNLFSFRAF